MKEAQITINGVALTIAQAMTVRVAIGDMLMRFEDPHALGADKLGRSITWGYRASASSIQDLIFRSPGS